jgi:tetratricopeptide (TPR) repeat protein
MLSDQSIQDATQDVEAYFTGREDIRGAFSCLVTADKLSKHILVIHGIGGTGKTSLLQMFRLDCKRAHVPVALVSGNKVKLAVDLLFNWATDLKADGVILPSFARTYKRYRNARARVNKQENQYPSRVDNATEIGTKIAAKTAQGTATAAIEAVVSPYMPGFGGVVGAFGGAIVGTVAEELGNFLGKRDVDLLLDPAFAEEQTSDFVDDIMRIASKRRIVLMLDTFEQVPALHDWTCYLAQRLHPNVLLVIAGREMVNWNLTWNGWMARAEIRPLEPMTTDVMRELVRRYYGTQTGQDLELAHVEEIIRFSRGLPMAVTIAVWLWVRFKYQVKGFEEVEAGVLRELVDRLREGVPPEMIPVLESASTLRYFNKPMLRAVSGLDIDAAYEDLMGFPFVKSGTIGTLRVFRLHDTLREFMDRGLQVDDPERYQELHKRAAYYYEGLVRKRSTINEPVIADQDVRNYIVEALWHRLSANKISGLQLVRTTFMAYLRRYDIALCDELLAMLLSVQDSNAEIRLCVEYLSILLVQSRSSWEYGVDRLKKLLMQSLTPQLETEVRWNLGITLDYSGDRPNAMQELSYALKLARAYPPEDPSVEVRILTRLGILQAALINFDASYETLAEAVADARKIGDSRLLAESLNEINYLFQRYDRFEDARLVLQELVEISENSMDKREQGSSYARLGEYLVDRHDYSETTAENIDKAISLFNQVKDQQSLAWANRCKGLLLMGREEPRAALRCLEQSIEDYKSRGTTRGLFRSYVVLCECLVMLGELDKVRQLFKEVDDWGERVALGDWMARWLAVQGDIEILDRSNKDRGVAISLAVSKYSESLEMGMQNSCSLLYQLADHVAARIRSLRQAGYAHEAKSIASFVIDGWLSSTANGDSPSQTERSRCAHLSTKSVVERINSGLG